jgi:diacylglycerol kinase (ATP)
MNSTTNSFSLKSFLYAFKGLKEATGTQPNFRMHILSAFIVVIGGLFLKITNLEWCMVLIAIGIVTASECFNTALEYLTTFVSPQFNERAGKIKDLSAAGVLICSLISAAIGLIIFLPKIISNFF